MNRESRYRGRSNPGFERMMRQRVRRMADDELEGLILLAKQEQERRSGSEEPERRGVLKPEARERLASEDDKIEGQDFNLPTL